MPKICQKHILISHIKGKITALFISQNEARWYTISLKHDDKITNIDPWCNNVVKTWPNYLPCWVKMLHRVIVEIVVVQNDIAIWKANILVVKVDVIFLNIAWNGSTRWNRVRVNCVTNNVTIYFRWKHIEPDNEIIDCILVSESFKEATNPFAVRNLLLHMGREKKYPVTNPPQNKQMRFGYYTSSHLFIGMYIKRRNQKV